MSTAFKIAANTTAAFFPRTFKASAGREFMRPRVKQQTDKGRDWLASLKAETFDGPEAPQRVYRGGEGPLVIFQHGWEADSADLTTMGQAIMAAGYSVALIDGPAHGQSEGRKSNMLYFARGLGLAGEQLGQPHAMIAHSMGLPATVLAMARFGYQPGRVIGLGAPDALPRNVAFQGERLGLSQRAIALTLEAVTEAFGEPASHFDITRDAPHFSTPALLLHGDNDIIAPPEAAHRIAKSWPGAQAHTFDGIGHRGILRDERVVERVLGFLT